MKLRCASVFVRTNVCQMPCLCCSVLRCIVLQHDCCVLLTKSVPNALHIFASKCEHFLFDAQVFVGANRYLFLQVCSKSENVNRIILI